MGSVRITYMVCHTVFVCLMIVLAMLAPLYITPGYYWWSILLVVFALADGVVYGKRVDKWEGEI